MARPPEIILRESEIFLIEQDVKNTINNIVKKEDLDSNDIQALENQVQILKKLVIKKTGKLLV